jgi:hypothetical protein
MDTPKLAPGLGGRAGPRTAEFSGSRSCIGQPVNSGDREVHDGAGSPGVEVIGGLAARAAR